MKKRKKNGNGHVFNKDEAYRCYPFASSYFKIHFTLKVFWDNFLNVRALPDCNSLSPGPRMMTLFIQQHFSVHAYAHIKCVGAHADFLQLTGSVPTYLLCREVLAQAFNHRSCFVQLESTAHCVKPAYTQLPLLLK